MISRVFLFLLKSSIGWVVASIATACLFAIFTPITPIRGSLQSTGGSLPCWLQRTPYTTTLMWPKTLTNVDFWAGLKKPVQSKHTFRRKAEIL